MITYHYTTKDRLLNLLAIALTAGMTTAGILGTIYNCTVTHSVFSTIAMLCLAYIGVALFVQALVSFVCITIGSPKLANPVQSTSALKEYKDEIPASNYWVAAIMNCIAMTIGFAFFIISLPFLGIMRGLRFFRR